MKTTQQMSGDVGAEPNPLDSFGIVTLASLYPVNAVFILGLICKAVYSTRAGIPAFHLLWPRLVPKVWIGFLQIHFSSEYGKTLCGIL